MTMLELLLSDCTLLNKRFQLKITISKRISLKTSFLKALSCIPNLSKSALIIKEILPVVRLTADARAS